MGRARLGGARLLADEHDTYTLSTETGLPLLLRSPTQRLERYA
jgi:hypothetical protein